MTGSSLGDGARLTLLALLGAAVGEGIAAWISAAPSLTRVMEGFELLCVAAGLLWLGGLLPAAALGLLAGTERPRRLGRSLAAGFGGPAKRGDVALLVGTLAAVAGASIGAMVGIRALSAMTARFAVIGAALVTLLALALLALLAPLAGFALGKLAESLPWPATERRGAALLAFFGAAGLGLAMRTLLSITYAAAPVGAAIGAGLGLALPSPRGRLGRRAELALAASVTMLSLLAPVSVGSLAPLATRALHYQTAFVGPLIEATRPVWGPGKPSGVQQAGGVEAPPPPSTPQPPWSRPEGAPRMNVVLILMDGMRPDHLGFAGYERPTSPHLDQFKGGAVWFRNAYTPAPSTRFAMASMFTGSDVRRLPRRSLGSNRFELLPDASTVAEQLSESGYLTIGHTISYVVQNNLGLGQGFSSWGTPWPRDEWASIHGRAATVTTRASIASLREISEEGIRPFLLFAHYRCTHEPFIAHPEWNFGSSLIDRYDSALAYCDDQVSRLLATVDARADAERTAIFVVSDHGELFGEHGLWSHGNSLYEPDVRITLLMRVPGAPAGEVTAPVLLSDVAPTILSLAGLPEPEGGVGWNLLPHALGEYPDGVARPLHLYTELWRGIVHYQATATLDWPVKTIRDQLLGFEERYDVAADPGEAHPLL